MENNKGLLRIFIGFMLAFGAVGHMDANPDADMLLQAGLAFSGLAMMWWGAEAHNKHNRSQS